MYNRDYTYDVIREKTNRSKSTINNVIKKYYNNIDNLIKKIQGSYFYFNTFRKLFLKNINTIKPVNEKIETLEYLKYTSC